MVAKEVVEDESYVVDDSDVTLLRKTGQSAVMGSMSKVWTWIKSHITSITDSTPTASSTNLITSGAVQSGLASKQNTLTFDEVPTASSTNPVTSGGIKSALDDKQDNLTFDNLPTENSSNPVKSSGVYSENSVRGRFYSLTCSTDGATENKVVELDGYSPMIGDIIGVTFDNANTYGDTTADTVTYPSLVINGNTFAICDSRGNYAGTGCWNDSDYIEFRVISTSKVCITNSDIRQSVSGTSGYTIYSNGFVRYYIVNLLSSPINAYDGIEEEINLPITMKDTNYNIELTVITSNKGALNVASKRSIKNNSKTTTSFVYCAYNDYGSAMSVRTQIIVTGYIA